MHETSDSASVWMYMCASCIHGCALFIYEPLCMEHAGKYILLNLYLISSMYVFALLFGPLACIVASACYMILSFCIEPISNLEANETDQSKGAKADHLKSHAQCYAYNCSCTRINMVLHAYTLHGPKICWYSGEERDCIEGNQSLVVI